MTTLKLKPKQTEILNLLYKFRFLSRNQIQSMLGHKHFNRVIAWLNDLNEKKMVNRDFSRKFAPNPSVYFLGVKSRNELKDRDGIKNDLLSRVYREKHYSKKFRAHSMFLAQIYLSLLELTKKSNSKLHFSTKTDLTGMHYLILPVPDAYFAIEEENGSIKRYFLDIFDDLPPRMIMRKRIKQHFNYYEKEYWQNHTKNPFPEIIIVCPDNTSRNYLKNYIGKMLEDKGGEVNFYLALREDIKARGLGREVLQKV